MSSHFYIGVDGGATKCIVRVEDEEGRLLGQELSGPASIRISVQQTWQSILTALNQILQKHNLSLTQKDKVFHAGMGLAGCEIKEAYDTFIKQSHHFKTLVVSSDSHTACLGAHAGQNGAIIIAGTGVVGFQLEDERISRVGGWGFPHDDEGGGAWLGLQGISHTFKYLDGREQSSALAEEIFNHFSENQEHMVSWANQANSTAFAELAPIVIANAKRNDQAALNMMKQAAYAIEKVSDALRAEQNHEQVLPCALLGGVAAALLPYLNSSLRSRLRQPALTPDAGAVLLARRYIAKKDS